MFARPGITALRDQVANDMVAALGFPTLLRRSPLRALAYALAGAVQGVYGYLDWIARQSVPFTAEGAFLVAWAALVGIGRKPAASATALVTFTGTAGTPIPAGTVLRQVGGTDYATTADAVLTVGQTVPAIAIVPGAAGTLTDVTPFRLASLIVGVDAAATAVKDAAGADQEADGPFRTRMLFRWAQPPQGGALADYLEWALAVPGVTRAWVNPNGAGVGTVVVYTMWDTAEAAHGGFPQGTNGVAAAEPRGGAKATGDQLVVANALHPLRPVTALVIHCAPIPQPVPFGFATRGLVSDAVKAAAAAALDDVFIALADPLGGVLDTSPFETAVAAVPGMPKFTMRVPSDEFSAPLGYLPTRGVVTWTVAT